MGAKLLDGKKVAQEREAILKLQIQALVSSGSPALGLAVILVGENPASQIYVGKKRDAAARVGIRSEVITLPTNITQTTLVETIQSLNHNDTIDGILVQLPLPEQMNADEVIEAIEPNKDVDGFHPYHLGRLAHRHPLLRPCTPCGIIHLLDHYEIPLKGSDAVVVGASSIVGRPMALELLMRGATTTVCHRFTRDLKPYLSQADILISAMGQTGVIQAKHLKKGVVIVDVGINQDEEGTMTGDIDFDSASQVASWITPVPGGVGPMTVLTLLENTMLARRLRSFQ